MNITSKATFMPILKKTNKSLTVQLYSSAQVCPSAVAQDKLATGVD